MKENINILTLQEIEALCRLYWDCGLTPVEEAELLYILLHTGHDTPLIRETKAFMGVESMLGGKKHTVAPTRPFYKRFSFYAAAALMAGIVACAIGFLGKGDVENPDSGQLIAETSDSKAPLPQDSIVTQEEPRPLMVGTGVQETIKPRIAKATSTADPCESFPEYDSYVVICNEEEALLILEEIQSKFDRLLVKSIDVRDKLPDLNKIAGIITEKT